MCRKAKNHLLRGGKYVPAHKLINKYGFQEQHNYFILAIVNNNNMFVIYPMIIQQLKCRKKTNLFFVFLDDFLVVAMLTPPNLKLI